jgi:hypothetical protein
MALLAGTAGLFVAARLTPAGPLSLRDNVQVRSAYLSNLEVLILPHYAPVLIACGDGFVGWDGRIIRRCAPHPCGAAVAARQRSSTLRVLVEP